MVATTPRPFADNSPSRRTRPGSHYRNPKSLDLHDAPFRLRSASLDGQRDIDAEGQRAAVFKDEQGQGTDVIDYPEKLHDSGGIIPEHDQRGWQPK